MGGSRSLLYILGYAEEDLNEIHPLGENLDAEGANARLVVKTNDKSYSGVAHEHGHEH